MQKMGNYEDYKLLDMANGQKLEKWGKFILIRPDPQVIWSKKTYPKLWNKADAKYIRSSSGGGHWEVKNKLPDSWCIELANLKFNIKPMGFKHTGLFPEQEVNWIYMLNKIKPYAQKGREIKVLNLFAYTGGATVACLAAGASVCHVDASKPIVAWAKENVNSSGFKDAKVRYIVDDVVKFVEREIRRGNTYDAIIMDPPSYGRGASGEVWNIEKDLEKLVTLCMKILSKEPVFFAINTYTGGLSGSVIYNLLKLCLEEERKDLISKGQINVNEIGIGVKDSTLVLPCGITTRWECN